ncbi:MAG: hypothetical protein QNK23_03705 [Crocinitomicaceae bacterium]|nr:hypothetical protein [Crocinitomicaceae bacterium]
MFTAPLQIQSAQIAISEIFLGIVIILIIILLGSSKKAKMLKTPGNEHYKYYMYNIYFKIFFALIFGSIYVYYYNGGDTIAYWDGAAKMNNLLWKSPANYWRELIDAPDIYTIHKHYHSGTGYPPGWIYRDPNSFYISKIISVFMIFLGQSYLVLTLVFAYISAIASWKLFEIVRYYRITSDSYAALSCLFIPSVAFWCTGLSKDTVVLIAVLFLLHLLFGLANKTITRKKLAFIYIFFLGFILYSTRTFMLFTVIAPMILAIGTRILKKYRENIMLVNFFRIIIISVTIGGFLLFISWQGDKISETTTKYLTEAAVQQNDFLNNELYGDKKYDLGVTDYSPTGMLSAAPMAIFTAIYRPALWEARSPLLIISGLETALFMYLTLVFIFKGSVLKKINFIRMNEFLVFSITFAVMLAFFAGFTSILFGVLVRIKAPLLPFILIILTTKSESIDLFKQKLGNESDN